MYTPGQVIVGRLPFVDGSLSNYRRPYLIVSVDDAAKEIKVLVISTVLGKEHKLNYPANIPLQNAIPPLSRPSFVKVDSCLTVSFEDALRNTKLLNNGLVSFEDMRNICNALAAHGST